MKRMVLYIEGSPNDRDSVRYAATFHRKFDGRLNVAHLRVPEHNVGSVARAIDIAQRAAALSRQAYDEVCGELESCAWLESEAPLDETMRQQGVLHDLTILERISEEEGPEVLALNIALFESGGPVLVLPPQPPETVAQSVALVWSPSAQSARALRSALPALTRAERVCVLTNSELPEAQREGVAAYLASHGVEAEARQFSSARLTARGRGRAILEAAREIGADFLVMGGYGENRLQSILGLGRTTQKIVSGSPMPVLLQR